MLHKQIDTWFATDKLFHVGVALLLQGGGNAMRYQRYFQAPFVPLSVKQQLETDLEAIWREQKAAFVPSSEQEEVFMMRLGSFAAAIVLCSSLAAAEEAAGPQIVLPLPDADPAQRRYHGSLGA